MSRRKVLTAAYALRAGEAAAVALADALRRSPDRSTRALILARALLIIEPTAPGADIRQELGFVRRQAVPLIIPGYQPSVPLAQAFPGLSDAVQRRSASAPAWARPKPAATVEAAA